MKQDSHPVLILVLLFKLGFCALMQEELMTQTRMSVRAGGWNRDRGLEAREEYRTQSHSTVLSQVTTASGGRVCKTTKNPTSILAKWQNPWLQARAQEVRDQTGNGKVLPFKSTLLYTASGWEEKVYPQTSWVKSNWLISSLLRKASVSPVFKLYKAKLGILDS